MKIPPPAGETPEEHEERLREEQVQEEERLRKENAPPSRKLRVTRASDITARRMLWLWDGRIVLGGLTLLAGREGLGKSTCAVDITAQVTRGQLDGEHKGTPRSVVYVNSEDARDYTIVPRLVAADADLDRVIFLDAVTPDPEGDIESPLVLPLDVTRLADVVTQYDAALVVLDAATSVIDSRLDGDRDRQMRQGLESIARGVGEATGAAVLGIVHFGKRESADTGKLILGSIAWSQVARSVLAVARDEDSGDLIVSTTKANLGPGAPSLGARIITRAVSTPEGDTSVGRVEWLGETDRDARDHLGASEGDERSERDLVKQWLQDYLTETNRAPSKDVKKAARDAGFSDRTLARARTALAVKVVSEGFPRESFWSLPDKGSHATDSEQDDCRASDADDPVGAHQGGTTASTGPDQAKQDTPAGTTEAVVPVVPPHVHVAPPDTTGTTGPTCIACGKPIPVGADGCMDCFVAGRIDDHGRAVNSA